MAAPLLLHSIIVLLCMVQAGGWQDFPCLALNSDVSVFCQSWMLVLESWTSYQWKQQLCRKQKELSNYTQVWYEEETICFIEEYKDEEEVYGAWVAMEAIWGIKFSCLMFLILVVFVPALLPAADSGSAVPSLQQMILHCSHRCTSFCNLVPARTDTADE